MKSLKLTAFFAICMVTFANCSKKNDVSANLKSNNPLLNSLQGTPANEDSDGNIVVTLGRDSGNDGVDIHSAYFFSNAEAQDFGNLSVGGINIPKDSQHLYTFYDNGVSPISATSFFGSNANITVTGANGIAGFNINRNFPFPIEITNTQPDGTSTVIHKSTGITMNWSGNVQSSDATIIAVTYEPLVSKKINPNAPIGTITKYYQVNNNANTYMLTQSILSNFPSNVYVSIKVIRGFAEFFTNSDNHKYDIIVYTHSSQLYQLQD